MGSGTSGLYAGTRGANVELVFSQKGNRSDFSSSSASKSQKYAPKYHVVNKMQKQDKADPTIWSDSSGYFKNPSAVNIQECTRGRSVYYEGRKANGKMTYIVDTNGNLIFGKRSNPINPSARSPHPMLIGGKDPQVRVAGMIEFRGGKIYAIDTDSGHYRPSTKSLAAAKAALSGLPKEIFHKHFEWSSDE